MTPIQLAQALDLTVVVAGNGEERQIEEVYCCDLLSIVMGRAPADSAWITVMGNINAVAVAVLADVSCVILSEGMTADDACVQKAIEQEVCILRTDLPTFQLGMKIQAALS